MFVVQYYDLFRTTKIFIHICAAVKPYRFYDLPPGI